MGSPTLNTAEVASKPEDKGASRYDVRIQGGGEGAHGKADVVREVA